MSLGASLEDVTSFHILKVLCNGGKLFYPSSYTVASLNY